MNLHVAVGFTQGVSFFYSTTYRSDSAQPGGKLELNQTAGATILSTNVDNAVWRPTLWQLREMFLHEFLPFKGPGSIEGGKNL